MNVDEDILHTGQDFVQTEEIIGKKGTVFRYWFLFKHNYTRDAVRCFVRRDAKQEGRAGLLTALLDATCDLNT